MKRPLVWGTLFLVAGILFLGLAYQPAAGNDASLASQAPAEDSQVDAQFAESAQTGITLLSAVAGLGLIALSMVCYGSRFATKQ